jgi:hypothetical protein
MQLAGAWTEWVDWERYSRRQRMNLGGLVGQAAYEGVVGAFPAFADSGEVGARVEGIEEGRGDGGIVLSHALAHAVEAVAEGGVASFG